MKDLETIKEDFWKNHNERMREIFSEIDKKFDEPEDYHEKIKKNLENIDEMLKKLNES